MTHRHQRSCLFVLVSAAVFCLTGSAVAQTASVARTTEVTFFGGISAPSINGGERDHSKLKFETGVPFGGRIAFNFTPHHAVEFTVANPLSFYANYVYNFKPLGEQWVPYLTAGAGGSRYAVESETSPGAFNVNPNFNLGGADHYDTAFTGNFGGGLKYQLSGRLALRFDVRDLVGRHKLSLGNVPGARGGILRQYQSLNDTQFTAGIVFRFGAR